MRGRRLPLSLAILGILGFGGCASGGRFESPLRAWERSAVYQPMPYSDKKYGHSPDDVEDIWFAADDGTRLHGWYFESPAPKAAVLYAHGNAGNVSDLWPVLENLRSHHDLSVLAFDYRGYGRSEGVPSESGVLSDARAARACLAKRAGVTEGDIVLMGRSLGGGVVVDLASHDGARGLILESTFTSLPEVAGRQIRWLPVGWLMQNRFDSLAKIGRYQGPLLQSHGNADRLIPYEMGQQLFAAAPGPKQFVTIPGGDHNDSQSGEYYQALDTFIASLPRATPQPAAHGLGAPDAGEGT